MLVVREQLFACLKNKITYKSQWQWLNRRQSNKYNYNGNDAATHCQSSLASNSPVSRFVYVNVAVRKKEKAHTVGQTGVFLCLRPC